MSKFLDCISNNAQKVGFQLRKNSPDILVGIGIIGVVVGTVLACRATLKAKPVIEEHKEKVKDIREKYEHTVGLEKERDKNITKEYFKTSLELTKLYAAPVLISAASILSIVGSHKILTDRNMATAAAYTALSQTLRGYRKRVADKIGEDEERNIWVSPNKKELEEVSNSVTADDEKKKKKIEENAKKNVPQIGQYARIFDCGNPGWDDNPEFTLYFLRAAETQANNLLEAKGFLFLNEVYDQLGFERTQMGQLVGWLYDPKVVHKIDFGIYDIHDPEKRNFVNGVEQSIILDFNVDGVILNKIPNK